MRRVLFIAALVVFMDAACAEMVPTTEPVSPAHWERAQRDGFRRRVYAIAVNSSNRPVVLDCSDTRRIIPPRTEARVMIFDGENCDLQPRITYENQ